MNDETQDFHGTIYTVLERACVNIERANSDDWVVLWASEGHNRHNDDDIFILWEESTIERDFIIVDIEESEEGDVK